MNELPEGWEWTTVGELLANGFFADGDWVESKDQDPRGSIRLLQLADIGEGQFRDRSSRFINEDAAERLNVKFVEPGDVLVARMPDPIGRACLAPMLAQRAITVVDVCILRPDPGIEARWLMWALNSPSTRQAIAALATGTTRKRISRKNLATIGLAVPPLPEQRRIVATIEEHFSRLDAAETDLQIALARTTLLMQATLIATIPCNVVPDRWKVTTVDEAGATDLGRQRAPKYHSGDSMRPYLRVANVFEDRLDLSDVMEMDFDDDAWEKYRLVDGDILLNEGQSPHLVGRPAMYRGDPEAIAFTNSLIRFRAHNDVEPEWALFVFRRHLHARRFMAEASITTNIAHLALKRFRTVEFPKPPLAEQQRLVAQIRHDLEAIDRMRSEIQGTLKRLAATRRSILGAAFSGQLISQEPSDEPASVLLERIAAELAASKPNRKKQARL